MATSSVRYLNFGTYILTRYRSTRRTTRGMAASGMGVREYKKDDGEIFALYYNWIGFSCMRRGVGGWLVGWLVGRRDCRVIMASLEHSEVRLWRIFPFVIVYIS